MANAHQKPTPHPGGKRAVNVSISAELVEQARTLGLNLSATLEAAIARELLERRRATWLAENSAAIQHYNEDVEQHGAFSDGVRTF